MPEGFQALDLIDKDFQTLNMLKELKEIRVKELKENQEIDV